MIEIIHKAVLDPQKVYWKDHALARMRQRGITVNEVLEALESGSIIEEYRDDKPFPSVLTCGSTSNSRPLHMVIGVNENAKEIHIVTSYEPDPLRWSNNFTVRIKK